MYVQYVRELPDDTHRLGINEARVQDGTRAHGKTKLAINILRRMFPGRLI
jgi:hypothetical protein